MMLRRLSLIVAVCFFSSSCFGGEWWDKTREVTADGQEGTANGFEWTAKKMKEWANNIRPEADKGPHSKLAAALCDKFKWCVHDQKLAAALCDKFKSCVHDQTTVEKALLDLESAPEKIETVFTDLNTKDIWSFLLSFVDNSHGSAQAYLGDITDFDKSDFNQIIAQQRKLRQVFVSFQDMTQLSFDTPPNSGEYPVLSFVYQVSQKFPEMPEKTTLQDENKLPFFTNNDVARAKFLNSVVEIGRDNKLIDDGRAIKVFKALCQLSDEKTVDALYDQENRLEKLCIVPDKEYPTQQQCEILNTEEKKKQAQAFLELRKNLNEHLGCLNR
jgi:hypothetical protein